MGVGVMSTGRHSLLEWADVILGALADLNHADRR
jgi:hypothetical protein